jgi:type VI secretion system protein ImpF
MAELLPQERLQPSLLDRLTDDDPSSKVEPPERRVLTKSQLRQAVLRDLQWLFNAIRPRDGELADYPEVQNSVMNFGLPAFAGETATRISHTDLEQAVKQAIARFEPRIDSGTLDVKVVMTTGFLDTHNVVQMQIQGTLWAQPTPLELVLRSALDLETGQVVVNEGAIRPSRERR